MRWTALLLLVCCTAMSAEDGVLRGKISIEHKSRKFSGSGDAVISLTPYDDRIPVQPGPMARLIQRNKRFDPHLIAITTGTIIEFPNHDPFFHDVFSIYHGQPFDLGLYESGSARRVAFTKPGVSYIFCNIHPEMSALVVVLKTPFFTQTKSDGAFQISHLPPGRYKMEIWHELVPLDELASVARDVEIKEGANDLPPVSLHSSDKIENHLNKYGESYKPNNSVY